MHILIASNRLAYLATFLLPLCATAQDMASKPVAPAAPVTAAASANVTSEAVAACEQSVRALLATKGTPTVEVKFNGLPVSQPRMSNDEQWVLRGSGSWGAGSGQRTFSYTCNSDPRTSEAVGMVMRDTTPTSAKTGPARSPLEVDLTHLSPAVCESAIAVALKKRWPRVSEIGFDSATRSLKQTGPSTAELRGRGRALPAQGAPISHFGFDCEFDTRDGRLLSSGLSG